MALPLVSVLQVAALVSQVRCLLVPQLCAHPLSFREGMRPCSPVPTLYHRSKVSCSPQLAPRALSGAPFPAAKGVPRASPKGAAALFKLQPHNQHVGTHHGPQSRADALPSSLGKRCFPWCKAPGSCTRLPGRAGLAGGCSVVQHEEPMGTAALVAPLPPWAGPSPGQCPPVAP